MEGSAPEQEIVQYTQKYTTDLHKNVSGELKVSPESVNPDPAIPDKLEDTFGKDAVHIGNAVVSETLGGVTEYSRVVKAKHWLSRIKNRALGRKKAA